MLSTTIVVPKTNDSLSVAHYFRLYFVVYRLNSKPFNSSREVQSHLVELSKIISILFGAAQLMSAFLRSEILPSDKRVFIRPWAEAFIISHAVSCSLCFRTSSCARPSI